MALHSQGDLDRFVFLTCTEASGFCDLELWAGAEDGSRFVRRLVGQLDVRPEHLQDPVVGQRAGELLGRALELAGHLQQSDLVEAYLPTQFGAGAT